jgi:hypothetical protein
MLKNGNKNATLSYRFNWLKRNIYISKAFGNAL